METPTSGEWKLLSERAREGAIPPAEVIYLLSAVAQQLDAGAVAGWVSPDTIVVSNDGRAALQPPCSVSRNSFGPGAVTLTLSTVNRNALWAIPARSCSGTVVAP